MTHVRLLMRRPSNTAGMPLSQPSVYSNGIQTGFLLKSTNSDNDFSWRKIDICLIQKTKLIRRWPYLSVIRQDRSSSHRGGGLLTLVKEGIVYQRIAKEYQLPLEKQSIQIQLSRMLWSTIHNLYVAPIRREDTPALATTEPVNRFLAGGDLNAHSPLWGEHQPTEQRDELVKGWLLSQNAIILNDSTIACVNRGTGGLTPDITAISNALSTGTEWTVGEDLPPRTLVEEPCRHRL